VDDLVSFVDVAPTFLEAAGLAPHAEMTGRSLMNLLTSNKSGRIDPTREAVLLGQERGSHVRFDNLGYPMRAIRTTDYLFVMNLQPDRWPSGDPAYVLRGKPAPPSGVVREADLPPDARKRPAEQLFDITNDRACLQDLAEIPAYADLRTQLRDRLTKALIDQGDPRFHGYGDIWESYPRFGVMRPELGGFAERGEYNPKYQVRPPGHTPPR
jgi:uncharacterized sulfatase